MMCLNPVRIVNPKFDKNEYVINGRFCMSAFQSRYGKEAVVEVPCGHCEACLSRKANEWATRIYYEWLESKTSKFYTLTYAEEYLTWNDVTFILGAKKQTFELPVLSKRDVQLFMKRLRKKLGVGLRFFLGGEYGENFGRPHYHFILFNYPKHLTDEELDDIVQKCWSYGNIQSGDTNISRVKYVAKYIFSSSLFPNKLIKNWVKPFILTSRKPGLGLHYINSTTKEFHNESLDTRVYMEDDGVLMPMPRYYRDKIFTDESKEKLYNRWIDEPPTPPTESEVEIFLNRFYKRKKNKSI